jgi:wobble nucleotide-excising tRNase
VALRDGRLLIKNNRPEEAIMLSAISITNEASYSANTQSLAGLRSINFIFGTNGSGKTTISRVVADPASKPSCSLMWTGQPLERLVYNSDFALRTFAQQMQGIFTLGQAEAETLTRIETATALVQSLTRDMTQLQNTLGDASSGKVGELQVLRGGIEKKCWEIKTAHDPHFQEAFSGFRNSKVSFCDKALAEWAQNASAIVALDELKQRALTVFEKGLERVALVPPFDAGDLIALEGTAVLTKKVVGKEDIDIAALIRRLGNSDWVRQGLGYVSEAGAQCPFCQQDMDDQLKAKLNEYFDETYLADIAAIDRTRDAYATYSETLLARLEMIDSTGSKYLDAAAFRADIDRLSARVELNLRQLDRKRKEASAQVTLEGLSQIVASLSEAISKANVEIGNHNAMVDNLVTERATLVSQIWKCLLEESKLAFTDYDAAKTALDRAVAGLSAGLAAKRAALAQASAELAVLEREVTSVQPTVTEINGILRSFGFTGFRLATAGEHQNLYEIVRGDGSEAATTLSEGERSFITFLYFYHLIKGSTTTSGMNAERVVVFDDPVSSLDSDVLFIVSALIKRVLDEACEGTGLIKQVFLLTHNIYFHKEVSFDPRRGHECRAHETFWIVRKVNDASVITGYNHNPISTSYELLWAEVRSPNRSNITIQNTLRRILENYFKILGNLDKDDICARFDGRDQQICGSLFSWVNDGSHSFNDDLYISADDAMVARYLDVFRRIFDVTNHLAHYEMMIGPEAVAAMAAANAGRPTDTANDAAA